MQLPAFAFDGERETVASCCARALTIRYRGWECVTETDGEIADTGHICCNRNGRYRVFEARGDRRLSVRIVLRPSMAVDFPRTLSKTTEPPTP